MAGRAVRGSMYSVSASLVTLGLGFLRAVLLARLLQPEQFGLVALALFYLGLVVRWRSLGLDMALIHRQDAGERFRGTYFTLRLGLDLGAFGLLLAAIPILERAYPHMPGLAAVMAPLILASFMASQSQVQETLLRKNLAYGRLAAVDVTASAVMTVVAPYLAWRGWGVWALVAEQLSGLGSRFLLTWGPFRQWQPRLGWDRDEARRLWRYGRPTWVAGNLGYLLDQFDDFWVGTALGRAPLGYYSKSYEFALYPRRVLANPLVSVFGPIFARLQGDRLRLSRAFYRSAYTILRTGFLVAGAFSLAIPEFIHYVIGDQWQPLLWTFRLMLVYTLLDPLLMLVEHLLLAVGRPQDLQRARLAQLAFMVPAVVVGAWLGGINGVALAADGMLLVGAAWLYRPLRQVVDLSLRRLLFLPAAGLALAWAVGLAIEAWALWAGPGILALKLVAFVLLFGGLVLALEREDYLRALRELWQSARVRQGGA